MYLVSITHWQQLINTLPNKFVWLLLQGNHCPEPALHSQWVSGWCLPAAPSWAPDMQWLEQAPLFSASWLPCSPCLILGRLQMHQKGSTGFGLHCHGDFYGPQPWKPSWRMEQNSPSRVSPCPHESLWDPVVAVLVQGATAAEQGISLPKTWGIAELFLRVRFSAQEPEEQTYIILGWWQKGDLECWEAAERHSSSSAPDLSQQKHWGALHSTTTCFLYWLLSQGDTFREFRDKNPKQPPERFSSAL